MKHLVERKLMFPCGMLFLCLAQKQAQIWGRHTWSIVGFWSQNFAQIWTLVYWNKIKWHFGIEVWVWEKKYWEIELQPLGNESSPFCRTEWSHIHVKMAFFYLSVWLIGQGGWKSCCRPRFHSWQFTAQAQKWHRALDKKLQNSEVYNWWFF